jgi:hypothetical protein
MVAITGLHGVTATPLRIRSTKKTQVEGVYFIMFLATADARSLCCGTQYEADIGQERSCEVVVESR